MFQVYLYNEKIAKKIEMETCLFVISALFHHAMIPLGLSHYTAHQIHHSIFNKENVQHRKPQSKLHIATILF